MLIDTESAFAAFLDELSQQRLVAFDTETTGLKIWHGDRIAGMSFAFEDGRTFYLPVRHARTVPAVDFHKEKTERGGTRRVREESGLVEREFDQLDPSAIREVWDVIRQFGVQLVCHHAAFDVHMCMNEGVDIDGVIIYDTMVMAKIADNLEPTASLKRLAVKYISPDADAEERWLKAALKERGWSYRTPEGEDIAHYDWFTPAEMAPYAEKDALYTLQLFRIFRKRIIETEQVAIWKRETELLPVLIDMERTGVRVDLEFCREQLATARARLSELEESIYAIAGEEFDIASADQLGPILKRLGIKSEVLTPKGKESWAKAALARRSDALIVQLILEWRGLSKIVSTYLENFLHFADDDGVIHARIKQIEAVTGRTSMAEPNLQNVTSEERFGIALRRAFVPRPGHVLVMIDWKQIEARVMADYADEPSLLSAIKNGDDIHALTALRVAKAMGRESCGDMSCPPFAKQRKAAKTIFFALIYGVGARKLAGMLGVTEEEAADLRIGFWNAYPRIAKFAKETRHEANARGFVRNKYGRRYNYLLTRNPITGAFERAGAHAAVDHKIQGTSLDLGKIALIECQAAIKKDGLSSRIVLFVHDELIFETPFEEVDRLIAAATRVMTDYGDVLRVPIECDVAITETCWADERPYTRQEEARVA